jgi:two-component system response regulator YesN
MCELNKNAEKIGIIKFTAMTDNNYIWDAFSAFNTLDEIVSFSLNILSEYFMYIQDLQKSKNNIVKITNFIEKNYSNVNLSVNDISAHTFLSPAYMCTYFKQETGKTINQYTTEIRVKKAKELLMNKELRVLDISRMVGYSDGNYFTKIFKKIIGITPNEFRERIN